MPKLINLILLYGGKSGEHEVSLVSAASVLNYLDPNRYNIIPIGIDKEGCYFLNKYEELSTYKDALPVSTAHSIPLESIVKNGRLAVEADVVFPVVHGPLYEDGCLQGILEFANVAYVGCDVVPSAIGMDKDIARRLVSLAGIKSARYYRLSWHETPSDVEKFCQKVAKEFGFPLFVKPCSMGSSVGIHKAKNMADLLNAVVDAKKYDEEILVEEAIQGREIELSVLENPSPALQPKVSLPGEICVNHPDGFYSYTAKYLESEQTDLLVPAKLDDEMVIRLQQASAEIFKQLKCKGMARVDFFVNEENREIYFNEINTIPGFTPISMYPKLWQISGIEYKQLLDNLIDIALIHHHCRQQLVTHYK
ncbi:D-alanine--D-alanine ligase (plasmid) [Legionella adelaidensis]|uniref:D-alanine--D-alanine ligase n=1 Tax=Legionella adelaidensis TaxID=45056 RepID=A0A0W0R5U2_9GAMM|nr:D-alanine--D-alanine ligase family protein [Legionella adelaidensis]KTC66429.1 D-alanine--D-alanine ligase [Legionella adelaidensis]VEH85027.1 D-alanine--D-alanine ligase [Legionella adelaidensis]